MKGEMRMESLITWYVGIDFINKLFLITFIVIGYQIFKFLGSKLIQKSSKQESILRVLFVSKLIVEFFICIIGVCTSLFLYQMTQDMWFSVCIAIILPILIISNHLLSRKINADKMNAMYD